jgi:hypothetical protein
MNTLSRIWTSISTPPPTDSAVEVRFTDGATSLVIWTGARWFPNHPNRDPISWRFVPELEDLQALAS